jgi:hypothetical protein
MEVTPTNELANFNIVVEKHGTRARLAARGAALRGNRKGPRVTQQQGRGTSNTRAAAQDAASSMIQDQGAGMPAAAQAAPLQTPTTALCKSVGADKGGKRSQKM